MIAATEITNYRTAAASAVATKNLYLTNSSKPQNVLAIYGAGDQGRAHAEAFYHYFQFKEVRIYPRI